MATVTYIPEAKQSISAMRGLISYCTQDFKVNDSESGQRLVSGVNCNGENSFIEFMATKNAYGKKDGMNFYQYVQSFSPKENIDSDTAHKIALEFAARAWPGHEVLVTTHVDAPHIHSHFVINSVNFENGYKLRQNPNTLKELRSLSDEICEAHGLETLKPYSGGGTKISAREYRAAVGGDSWKFKLMWNIDSAMNKSGSREEFIDRMKQNGYEITWTDERKYITFTCPNGKKCRDKTLHDEKYLKENLEYELHFREEHYKNRKEFVGTTDREKQIWTRRNAIISNARDDSGAGKGLGYNGEPVTSGGGFSTEGIRADGNLADQGLYERDVGRLVGCGQEQFRQRNKCDEREIRDSANESGEYFASNGGTRTTGWEESRKNMNDTLEQGMNLKSEIARAAEKTDRRVWGIRIAISVVSSALAAVLSTLLCTQWLV